MPETIDDVIAELDQIIAQATQEEARYGYFAALYREVTVEVGRGIDAGRFEDGPRMERLDVIFAVRYLDAFQDWRAGRPTTDAWKVVFQRVDSRELLVLQHLLLGMNAHINLDLGIAAAETAPGDALPGLRRDFDEINAILFELLDEMQGRINQISPWLAALDRLAHVKDEWLAELGLGGARLKAWDLARSLAPLTPPSQAPLIARRDKETALLARAIFRTGLLRPLVWLVRSRESQDVAGNIAVLMGR